MNDFLRSATAGMLIGLGFGAVLGGLFAAEMIRRSTVERVAATCAEGTFARFASACVARGGTAFGSYRPSDALFRRTPELSCELTKEIKP